MSDRASATPTRGRSLEIFRVAGIRILIDPSWLLIFFLILWSLSAGYFPHAVPEASSTQHFLAGLAGSLLFFASILGHELAHSLVALRAGIDIPAITLFVFGGVSHMGREARRPRTELLIAIAGPFASFAFAALFWALAIATRGEVPAIATGLLRYLGIVNLALGIFNLIPGFPLDGGRVLRAIVWAATGSRERATRMASNVGRGVAVTLMALGAVQILMGGLIGGLWLIFIGMFLRGAARQSIDSMVIQNALAGVPVRRVMVDEVVSVDPDATLGDLVESRFLRYGYGGFPVRAADGAVLGLISIEALRAVPPEERATARVRDHMQPVTPELVIAPDAPLSDALERLAGGGSARLLVLDGEGRLVGLLTKTGLARFLEMHRLLRAGDSGGGAAGG